MLRSREAIINDIEKIEYELENISRSLKLSTDDKTKMKCTEIRTQLYNKLDKLYDELDSLPLEINIEGGLKGNVC